MKKVISIALIGAMVLGFSACSKTEPKKGSGSGTEADETRADEDDSGTPEIGSDEYYESIQYYVDPTNEAEITKILDAVYAGEPKLGDDEDTVCERITGSLGESPDEIALYSYGDIYSYGYSWDSNIDFLKGKDRLIRIGYWGYETNDGGDLMGNETVVAYEQSYVNPERPGAGNFLLWVYDEDRAKAAYDIISRYLTDKYAEYDPVISEDSLMGYQLSWGEGFRYYGYVRILYNEDDEIWQVYTEVFFADPELIEVSDLENLKTSDETEEVESSESLEITETELEILETEAAEEE